LAASVIAMFQTARTSVV